MNVNEFTTFHPSMSMRPHAQEALGSSPIPSSRSATPSSIDNSGDGKASSDIPCLRGYKRHLVRVHNVSSGVAPQILDDSSAADQEASGAGANPVIKRGSILTVDVRNCDEISGVGGGTRSMDTMGELRKEVHPGERYEDGGDQLERDTAAPIPILFLHGLASNMSIFWKCAEEAASTGCSVAVMSLRGHAESFAPSASTSASGSLSGSPLHLSPSNSPILSPRSPRSPRSTADGEEPYSVEQSAYDVQQVLLHLQHCYPSHWCQSPAAKAIVVGHSYGANVVVKLASLPCVGQLISGVVGVDGGYINLQNKYPTMESCCQALAPPSLQHMSQMSFEHMIRCEWAWGQPEDAIQHLLRNFGYTSNGSGTTVFAKLRLQSHMAFLRDLYENPPDFQTIKLPVLLLPAGSGGANHFSLSVKKDIDHVRQCVPSSCPVSVQWYAGASHMFIPIEFPEKIVESILSHTWQK